MSNYVAKVFHIPERELSPREVTWWWCLCGKRHHISQVIDFICDWCEKAGCGDTKRVECSHCSRTYCEGCAKRLEMFRGPNVCHETECLQKEVARLRGLAERK